MGGEEIGLNRCARIGILGQEMDMHLIGPAFGALVAEMGEIEARNVVPGLTEDKRRPRPVVMAANKDVICPRQGRAADQGVDAVQITPAGDSAPIVKSLSEGCL